VSGDTEIVLVGGGGHALVVVEAACLAGLPLAGFLDDDPECALTAAAPELARLGPLDHYAAHPRHALFLALGGLSHRRRALDRMRQPLLPPTPIVHPGAHRSPSAGLGPGVFVGPGAIVHTRAHIRAHCVLNSGCIVEHECELGENVHIAPGAVLGGRVTVGADTLVGLGARVLPNLRIGERCTVGAGAVVTRDVPDGQTVAGVPAAAGGK